MIDLTINRRWACPNCSQTAVTHEPRPHSQFHTCPGLRGIVAPMVPEGVKAKVVAHDREDYVGKDKVQTDENGRPIMSVVTTRDDGEDCVVYAPTAVMRA
jgi:hypothetical protein